MPILYRIFCGLFFIAFGLSMIVGQTFPFQGDVIGCLGIMAGIFALIRK